MATVQKHRADNDVTERYAEIQPRSEITDPRIEMLLGHVEGAVLDVGCVQHDPAKRADPNWLHQHLYREADSVLGVDVDAEGIRTLREAGYTVQVADAERLSLDETYDTIVAGELIEHLSCPGAFLDRARDRLRSGGKLVLSTPNPWCFARMKSLATPGRWTKARTIPATSIAGCSGSYSTGTAGQSRRWSGYRHAVAA